MESNNDQVAYALDEFSLDVAESDLAPEIGPDATVTWSVDWTVATVIDQLARDRFDLEPAFQRRDVWSNAKRSHFIESLLLGIPIPQVTLAERRGSRGRFIVLDGKQRLRSLQRFAGLDGEQMRLTGLQVLRELNGSTLDDLRSTNLDAYGAAFENQAIRAVVLRGWSSEALLYLTFLRLNSNVVGLSPQELRRALHPGPFMDFVMQASSESEGIRMFLRTKAPDFRMRDAELLIRHVGLTMRTKDYRGDLRRFLDETCEWGNLNWDSVGAAVSACAEGLDDAIVLVSEIFGPNAFRRPLRGDRYETRRNRAVLDIMAFYFQYPTVRRELGQSHSRVRELFTKTASHNPEFLDYLTATTKSNEAVFGRLYIWGEALSSLAPSVIAHIPRQDH